MSIRLGTRSRCTSTTFDGMGVVVRRIDDLTDHHSKLRVGREKV
jgi:hypothetical protein